MSTRGYAELHCLSAFSFLRGASMPQELVAQAVAQGYSALAITDECSMAGVVRAHEEAQKHPGFRLIIGSEFQLVDGPRFVALAENHDGYSRICALITKARRAAKKGAYRLKRADVSALAGCSILWIPGDKPSLTHAAWIRDTFRDAAWIAVELHRDGDDSRRLVKLQEISGQFGLPLCATGDVHMHVRNRRALQDTMTAIRHGIPIAQCGHRLFGNGERHLRSLEDLRAIYPPELIAESLAIADRCHFDLGKLNYQYPAELVPEGHTPTSWLKHLVEEDGKRRWPDGPPEFIAKRIGEELAIIAEMQCEAFFLTVHDIVRFARSRGILCQGRGSAANSMVCFALHITEVSPDGRNKSRPLFERFISKERNEPPDIDVDFEHQRREEVIQYVYAKYGRERAAIAATVIRYQPRSAVRDVGKALGFSLDQVNRLSKSLAWWDDLESLKRRLREQGFKPESRQVRQLIALTNEILGMPRHLSQHVGGFVISEAPLSALVPVENAAMPERTIIQWDKDDLETLRMLKVDVLALGMLSALRRSLKMVSDWERRPFALADIPQQDTETYAMIQRAETVGVFQIESRAQMSMLPRLRPEEFYDLVIQVAIVRPGPIQGDMVHPYLRRRCGEEAVVYPDEKLRAVLERTLGIPLFQEQVMEIAIVAAGFTAGEADQMRRSMAAWKRGGGFEHLKKRLFDGMRERGYTEAFAQSIFHMIEGFASYGFPESHAASFALLAYDSAWLKRHKPAAFIAGLLNSQPMGFYPPSMLVGEARKMGVTALPIDATVSEWDCVLERDDRGEPAIRLGFNLVSGFNEDAASRIVQARKERAFDDVDDLSRRARLNKRELDVLAHADALRVLAGHRHAARWAALGQDRAPEMLREASRADLPIDLPAPSEGEEILSDYQSARLTLRRHPVALLRDRLDALRVTRNVDVKSARDQQPITVSGLVMFRQRPEAAKGVMFMTLEDESGIVNLIVWPKILEAQRAAAVGASFVVVSGELQKQGEVIHVVARRIRDVSDWIGELPYLSRDFR
ncbi:MAG TPA: error-prone DNA polymerase [Nevskiaceae bacterium]|nr:error-prone DNA polymerase [Nevskiaceae bacterium]